MIDRLLVQSRTHSDALLNKGLALRTNPFFFTKMKVLQRLLPYFQQHAWTFGAGLLGLLSARIFASMIPLYVKQGIDSIASGRSAIAAGELDWQSAADALVYPALAIVACVVAQMIVTIGSRILIRRVGMAAAFDLRNRMYAHLQLQGPGV